MALNELSVAVLGSGNSGISYNAYGFSKFSEPTAETEDLFRFEAFLYSPQIVIILWSE